MEYKDFLASKLIRHTTFGKECNPDDIHPMLFPFQRDVTALAIRKGRYAIFLDTGLGKSLCQLEWARLMGEKTLIIAPLSVARQTVGEGKKIDLDVHYVRDQSEVNGVDKLWITNYEMVKNFDLSRFGAVVLDESSILKAIAGKTRRDLTKRCQDVPYRLCCTATPAPNDYIELGNHAEFLGICSRGEMLAMFFINANKEHVTFVEGRTIRRKGPNKGGQEWRLKHHAEQPFFQWLASWAITMIKPSDLGYNDAGFVLPPLNIHTHFVESDYCPTDRLFFTGAKGIKNQAEIRRATLPQRMEKLIEIMNGSDEQWIIWCGLNEEQDTAASVFGDECTSVYGSLSVDEKLRRLELWLSGKARILITKAKVLGFGMNFQCAHNMAFLGLGHSWEMWYQAIRRQWRYLQEHPVDVHIIMSDIEENIYHNVMRKDRQAKHMRQELIRYIRDYEKEELGMVTPLRSDYTEDEVRGNGWTALLGDACTRLKELEENSIDLSVYSPPFAELYVYTPQSRDLGNCRGWDEFFEHYKFIIREVLRVTKPGRLACVHTSDIPALQQKEGYIGLRDFPGRVIRAHEEEGWIFHGRCFVQKSAQLQAKRSHSKGLAFEQIRKDTSHSRPALIDQILIFRKEGENQVPIKPVERGELDNELWIEWAHGIWLGIRESDTLRGYSARAVDDEKHVCPLQLPTIERCLKLYSNPGETILSPFAGIGSEGYMAVKLGRKAVLIELKRSYFDVMVKNMKEVETQVNRPTLLDLLED